MFNQWELMSPMPEAVLHPAVAATNQRIYVFGGENAMQNPVRIIQVQHALFLIISLRYGRVVVSPQSKRVVGSISTWNLALSVWSLHVHNVSALVLPGNSINPPTKLKTSILGCLAIVYMVVCLSEKLCKKLATCPGSTPPSPHDSLMMDAWMFFLGNSPAVFNLLPAGVSHRQEHVVQDGEQNSQECVCTSCCHR